MTGPALHFLVVKHGALGDVVRTSYFLEALRRKHEGRELRISWVTSHESLPLLRFHPDLDDLWTSFEPAAAFRFDHVFSLDDEPAALAGATGLATRRLTGAYRGATGEPLYTRDAAEWFDMGLISRLGKARADELKKANRQGHAEIFSRIFEVDGVRPRFHGDPRLSGWGRRAVGPGRLVGINAFASGRWPSKELGLPRLRELCERLAADRALLPDGGRIVLLGAGPDRERNREAVKGLSPERFVVVDTDASPLHLAAVISGLDYLVSGDTLALHLGIAQGIPFTAFFAPTSAAEIDDWGLGRKVLSTAPDYCSYRKDADGTSISAERIHAAMREHHERGLPPRSVPLPGPPEAGTRRNR